MYPKRKELASVRRDNLRKLVEQWGGPTQLSKRLGYANPSYLVQMVGPNPTRDVTERMAIKVEEELNLPPGALSKPDIDVDAAQHNDISPVAAPQGYRQTLPTNKIASAVEHVAAACEKLGVKLTTAKFADVVAFVFDELDRGIEPDEGRTKKLIQLAT